LLALCLLLILVFVIVLVVLGGEPCVIVVSIDVGESIGLLIQFFLLFIEALLEILEFGSQFFVVGFLCSRTGFLYSYFNLKFEDTLGFWRVDLHGSGEGRHRRAFCE
jgi:hypothetical protein